VPIGHPYACPTGACINGLGALPSPYGPTLRGDHNALRASKKLGQLGVRAPNTIQANIKSRLNIAHWN